MPKDEFDFEDPLELNGVGLVCEEDTTEAMTECFVEEFMRLGYNHKHHKQILALFRNPHYIGMNMALQNRGEPFVREKIAEVFARWGRPVAGVVSGVPPDVEPGFQPGGETSTNVVPRPGGETPPSTAGGTPAATDPMGAPLPDVTI
jgi:hypothetical protein